MDRGLHSGDLEGEGGRNEKDVIMIGGKRWRVNEV
jgi:hypothetical protein